MYEEINMSGIVGVFYLFYSLIMLAIIVGSYVLQSLSFYTIAKRRGIKHPWLSWIPVGGAWILGCISDQYQYVVKGKVKNKRKALLVLQVIMYAALVTVFVIAVDFIIKSIAFAETDQIPFDTLTNMTGSLLGMIGAYAILFGVAVAISVIQYISLYDLYTSCEPKNNVLYLLLSILVNISQPILLFICRNKDLGMPPRRQDTAFHPQELPVEEPAWQPAEEPEWQPAEEPKEPWENNPEE